MSDIEYLYTVSFVAENDIKPNLLKFVSKAEMLTHLEGLLKIWGIFDLDLENMIDAVSDSRRFFLSGENMIIVNKISKDWFS